ncbi:hypothetical protein M422DRAFT_138156, partial [Sphaerobolus stellatus SS14]
LGHVGYTAIKKMTSENMATGMPIDLSSPTPVCQFCILGKQTKTPIPKEWCGERATRVLEKVHADLMGPEVV